MSRNGSSYVAIAAGTNFAPESNPTKWSLMAQKGDTGATGATGATGPAGADATNLWAVVTSTGTLSRGSGVVGVTRSATGSYRVQFNQTIDQCTWQANAGPTGTGTAWQGLAQASLSTLGNDRVQVNTWNGSLVATDIPFHLTVFC